MHDRIQKSKKVMLVKRSSVALFGLAALFISSALFHSASASASTACCCNRNNPLGGSLPYCVTMELQTTSDTCASYAADKEMAHAESYYSTYNYCCEGQNQKNECKSAALVGSGTAPQAPEPKKKNPIIFIPNISIPGSDIFVRGGHVTINGKSIGEYASAIYSFLAGAIAMIAAVMILYGGFQWMTASGNAGNVQKAKTTIYSSLIAIVLTLGSYLMLYTINPQLVKFRDLASLVQEVPPISEEEPQLYSEALIGNTAAQSLKSQYDAQSCPTDLATLKSGFKVFLTGYYRPAWGSTGGYGSFQCNLAMQCWCAHDSGAAKCGPVAGYNKQWQPCNLSKVDQNNYCNKTSSSTKPIGLYDGSAATPKTAAVNVGCFGRGTTFSIQSAGSAVPANVAAATWIAQDTGSAIRGRHIDLFLGTGDTAYQTARTLTGEATLVVKHYCPPSGGTCVDL